MTRELLSCIWQLHTLHVEIFAIRGTLNLKNLGVKNERTEDEDSPLVLLKWQLLYIWSERRFA